MPRAALLLAILATCAPPARAERLKGFSQKIAAPPSAAAKAASSSDDESRSTWFAETALAILGEASSASAEYALSREGGEPSLPWVRVDQAYQRLEGRVDGASTRLELGRGVLGGATEFLRYWERNPADRLDSISTEALWRLASDKNFRFELALGYRKFKRHHQLAAEGSQGGISFGYYGLGPLGLEGDLRWISIQGNAVGDHRGRVRLRLTRGLSLFGGYRAIRAEGASLRGPETGLTFFW